MITVHVLDSECCVWTCTIYNVYEDAIVHYIFMLFSVW